MTIAMRQRAVQCLSPAGLHNMAYVEWGDPDNRKVLVCVHGLTRCSRDFDFVAQALAQEYRVVCPDVVGRGRSDWLVNKSLYGVAQYAADMVTLLARLDVEGVDWVGTSMGGLIGMALAAQARTPIRRLLLVDVGPVVTAASIARISEFVGKGPRFDSVEQAEAYIRVVAAPFGPLTDAQWRHLTEHSLKCAADGKLDLHYDPGIAEPFRAAMGEGKDYELWQIYDLIRCPTRVLRGETSDVLTPETAREMQTRGPHAQVVEIAGVGHAPMLMNDSQVTHVRDFFHTT
ncbi:MAG: alpha/beta hydrolase [Burkholderiales bacterium]|jgi:pimeloyl-ACP methyl ester carboxylesterase|nr:alpha/beta hydrolase [Burkholderiales bacterium]